MLQASHVAMSTKKLLGRIMENDLELRREGLNTVNGTSSITSNPLTQFAIVFAALIHDLDHQGVSNAQLVEEGHAIAFAYDGKSVAEQNSIDVAWRLLMEPRFSDLRACIYTCESELKQFRQIVVNAVMATDLFDKNLKAMRELRWTKSFSKDLRSESHMQSDDTNRRATIIVDLIIQASDVSHTMQHFTIYQKWNQNLLTEMYDAYLLGRTSKNPVEGWYEGELWFFDNYVIPLAQKLRECGVFGVSCDEFLDYAKDNRAEWEAKGEDIVRNVMDKLASRTVMTASTTFPLAL
jgi:3'5'-cyclic nucleotide phosphodiesterase